MEEQDLIASAKGGDQRSFEKLLTPHLSTVRAVVFRMIGHPDDAADLAQETQLRAFSRLDTFRGESSFGTWLVSIATHACLDHLRKETRWRPYSQKYAEQECHGTPELLQEVHDTVSDPAFAFDVHEHIAFCFTCVARSLPPEQEAAIILREICDYSNRDAAKILDITESVLRHHLAAGREAMKETYEGLCSLVNKQGVCYQCSGFRNITAEGRKGPEVQPFLPEGTAAGEQVDATESRFRLRLRVVREHEFAGGASERLHDLIFHRIRTLERQAASVA